MKQALERVPTGFLIALRVIASITLVVIAYTINPLAGLVALICVLFWQNLIAILWLGLIVIAFLIHPIIGVITLILVVLIN